MGRKPLGERVRGPYEVPGGWRVDLFSGSGADSARQSTTFASQRAAQAYRDECHRQIDGRIKKTISDAIDDYEVFQRDDLGNKPVSYIETKRRLRSFFGVIVDDAGVLVDEGGTISTLNRAQVQGMYDALRGRLAVDTHRIMLAQAKTFLRWCVGRRWLQASPLDDVKGTGKRKHGKPQLTADEARAWMDCALGLAPAEPGAVAALCTLLMAMRAGEVVARQVRDLDEDGAVLWIRAAKTDAGNRRLEVPSVLRPFLLALAQNRDGAELLFGKHWRDWPREWVQKICRAAEVPVITAHGMRGTHATLASSVGATGEVVARALGHEDVSTTYESYAKAEAVQGAKQKLVLRALKGGRK
jgi:integrase